MRFVYGPPPAANAKDFLIEDISPFTLGYEKIFRYGPIASFFLLVTAVVFWLVGGVDPLWPFFLLFKYPLSALMTLLTIVCVTVAHEVVHLISYPDFWRNEKAGFGFASRVLMPYAWYAGVLSKKRAMYSLLAPFVWLTCLPLVIQFIFHPFGQGSYIPFVSIFNAMSVGGDLLLVTLIFMNVPSGAYVQGTGFGMRLKENVLS